MTILMTADTIGGIWQYALELARGLGRCGARVELATMGAAPTDAQRRQAASCGNVTLHESAFALEWMDEPWREVDAAGDWLLELAARARPDVIHLNGYTHAALPWRTPVLAVAHSDVCSWWQATHGEPAPARYDEYRRRVARGLAAADRVVAPTATMLRALREHYEAPAGVVIRNGRRAAGLRPLDKRRYVAAAGRVWDASKNLALLARVAPRIEAPVRIAGADTDPDGRRVELRGVELLGRLSPPELAGHYGHAPVFAAPARYEPFGLATLEAALSGCALVLADIDTYRELWDGVALFAPADDEDAWVSAIGRVLASESERRRLARAAFHRALGFGRAPMAVAYHDAYDALVRGRLPQEVPLCAS